MILRKRTVISLIAAAWLLLILVPRQASAIPQFARRYKVSCYACHTIPPVLNEQGYMFKRLGHHLPPALEASHPVSKILELVEKEPDWTITNNASLAVADFGFASQRTTQQGQAPSSTSAFQVNSWNAYFAGWIPNTNFYYYSEFDIVLGGQTSPDMPNAHIGYVGGTAKSSWYTTLGREHLQVSEGTRASQIYSLLPNAPLLFENMGPTNFILDQSPVGAEIGYTWASSGYKNILGVNFKVTNGDNADGSEILSASSKNGKDTGVQSSPTFWRLSLFCSVWPSAIWRAGRPQRKRQAQHQKLRLPSPISEAQDSNSRDSRNLQLAPSLLCWSNWPLGLTTLPC